MHTQRNAVRALSVAVTLTVMWGCADLNVPNINEPDRERSLRATRSGPSCS